ncbi:MucB/RseB C-terminal domain-containing protein [Ramlibacter sp. AW1]|uniref:MucB/RseB C-terminal domain-containing protein n=1 Tax=Ramlibacter aurantiacus TaxID=2801330 RepID=A0A937D8J8_9BURK|nr:MucB/RseB C-terminal domain-containing protein [Ramlibacter aurantiacus]MBL0423128.1 MucB/RseB C-terminal domain-containing protein [Ramlibacter aurantiacus]
MDRKLLQGARAYSLGRRLLMGWLCGVASFALAQAQAQPAASTERSLSEWLDRVHAAPRRHNYIGTIVVSSNAGAMSSARIWHACDDDERQVERIEALSGPPRSSVRRDNRVMTFLPEQKLVRVEYHESLSRFPDLFRSGGAAAVAELYTVRPAGTDRIAGFETDVVLLAPRDAMRFAHRVWTERRTGLVLKRQTLAPDGAVLEQTAFSELQLDVPLRPDRLLKQMQPPPGWRMETVQAVRTTAVDEGWDLKPAVTGYKPVACYRRGSASGAMQCVFSDGLASVSLFVEPAPEPSAQHEGALAAGATHTLTRRIPGWSITAVGEVPQQTLRAFAQSLERRP